MKHICPLCGGEDLTKEIREQVIPLEFGRDITIEAVIYNCPDCGMEGDLFEENDKKIEAVLAESQKQTVELIIDDLSDQDISMAYIERAMSLPTRTIARWKKGEISSSGYALLKTVKTFPWVLEVAEKRFDHNFAMERMIAAASEAVGPAVRQFMDQNGLEATPVRASNGQTALVGVQFERSCKEIDQEPKEFSQGTISQCK